MTLTVDQTRRLRELALQVTSGDLRRPWSVQTSNSFRRLGTDRGDGDVLCAVKQRSDGHPDLHAAPGVLDYIVAAHPFVVLELLEQRDRAWHTLDRLLPIIESLRDAFAEAQRPGRAVSMSRKCECDLRDRQWNGFGRCLRCGAQYVDGRTRPPPYCTDPQACLEYEGCDCKAKRKGAS